MGTVVHRFAPLPTSPLRVEGQWWLERACLLLAGFFALCFIVVALSSMTYPFHLEWMEGQNIDVINRIRQGEPVYVAPSIEYVPYIYTPYYYYVAAFVSLFTGVDFFAGRLVSTLAAIGTGVILYRWIRGEGGSKSAAIITAGLFFATYKLSGRWFDAARIDSLFLFLTLSGLYVFYFYRGWANALTAAALMTAAFFTKQSALMALAPALGAGVLIDKQHTLRTAALWAGMMLTCLAAYDIASDGWFSFYVFTVPAGHGMDRKYILGFWNWDMLTRLGFLFALSAIGFLQIFPKDKKKALWYGVLVASFIGTSYASRIHWGGYLNVLMPAHAALALAGGLALTWLSRHSRREMAQIGLLLALIQLGSLVYNPSNLIPSHQSEEKGKKFLEGLAKIQGDIFMPELQWVQTRVGKKSYAFGMAGFDIIRSNLGSRNYIKTQLDQELRHAIAQQRFAAVTQGRLVRVPNLETWYHFAYRLDYPKEYVTGAINFVLADIYLPGGRGQ